MTLPTRKEALQLATVLSSEWGVTAATSKIVTAYADGVLQTREKWAATIDYECPLCGNTNLDAAIGGTE